MFDRLMEIFRELPGSGFRDRGEKFADDDPRLAAAALLLHLMNVDGESDESERKKLSSTLSLKYGLKSDALKQLLKAAEQAGQEATDLSSFTSVLKEKLDYGAQLDFVALMWEIVCVDGEARELETTVVWRIAELMGIRDADRNAIELRAQQTNRSAPAF
ncbi:TerB family tellurite resistance protein [Brucellaceae bacterium D45D]